MKSLTIGISASIIGLAPFVAHAQSRIHETQSTLTEWIDVEKNIAEKKADWTYEKEIILDTLSVLEEEKEILLERIKSAQEASSEADGKRIKLNEEKQTYIDAVAILESEITALESEAKRIYQWLPESLQTQIEPLYKRIPELDEKKRMPALSSRLQSVLGILTQADKFNSGISLNTEIKELGSGNNAQVKTMYFGLAGAYFTDDSGTYSGIGYPTAEGWKWETQEGVGPLIANSIGAYESVKEAAFIELPVSIK